MLSVSLILKTSPSIPAAINRARFRKAVILLTATATIIRLELALFVLPTVLSLIQSRRITWREGITWGAFGGFGSLRRSIPVPRTSTC
jgi:alpha-1,6-mannosyltransferase